MSLASNLPKEPSSLSKYSRNGEKSQQRLVPSLNYKLKSKENSEAPMETCPSFRARQGTPELKHDREDISEKLKQIRRKYENQMAVNRTSIERTTTPLQELNNQSKTPRYPEVDLSANPRPTIQRTFSFINIESVESKPETVRYQEESFVEPVGDRGDFGAWKVKQFQSRKPAIDQPATNMHSVREDRNFQGRKFSYQPNERNVGDAALDKLRDLYKKDNYSSKSKQLPADYPSYPNYQNSEKKEPAEGFRIDSIDKINVRIKEILKSINEGDVPQKASGKMSYHSELNSKPPKPAAEEFKPPALKFTYNRTKEEEVAAARHNVSCYPPANPITEQKDNTAKHESKTARYSAPRTTISSEIDRNGEFPSERPLTFRHAGSAASRDLSVGMPPRNAGNNRSIKDLDKQIERIQQKIKHSEEEKKRLWSESEQKPPVNVVHNEKNNVLENRRSYLQNEQRSSKYPAGVRQETRQDTRHESRQEPQEKPAEHLQDKYRNCRYTPGESALDSKAIFTATTHSVASTATKTTAEHNMRDRIEEIRQRTQHNRKKSTDAAEEGIPKAEKLNFKIIPVSYETEGDINKEATETRRFIEALRQQVSLDEELRNAKIWLDNSDLPNKWEAVRGELAKQHQNLNLQDVERCFTSSLEEHNPFFTMKNYHESLQSVVQKYLACEQFWQQNLRKRFNGQQLKKERFQQDRLDLERKGFLTVEDLVRFLNIETGTFYRNRDLILLFRRFTQQEKMSFGEFMGKVTN